MSMLNLDEHDKKVEGEIVEVKEMVQNKTITSNKAIILQTIAVILTLVGIALAYERRVTIVEERTRVEIVERKDADALIFKLIEKLQGANETALQNQARVITLLDAVEKRHAIEDQKRIR